MDDAAALRRTLRRCTAALVVTLTPALRPISDYQYDGTLAFAIALGYLIVSATVQFDEFTVRREEGGDTAPDDAVGAEQGGDSADGSRAGSDADG
ncbi:hypothetical protein ACFQL4_26725 [Halosimplex aquaticum]